MNLTQYLLVKVAEEAGEVAKEALKSAQFGLGSEYQGDTAAAHLRSELLDLVSVVKMLEVHAQTNQYLSTRVLWPFTTPSDHADKHIEWKWRKVCWFALKSVKLGLLTLTPEEQDWVEGYAKLYCEVPDGSHP